MASKSKCNLLLLSAAVLASMISAATAASEYGYSECFLGIGFPSNDPLPSCRDYVAQQICGVFTPGSPFLATGQPYLAKMQCCQELASVPQQCRCEALRYLKALPPSRPDAILELPGCPRELQGEFLTLLVAPGQCNLVTLEGAPYCPAAGGRPGFEPFYEY